MENPVIAFIVLLIAAALNSQVGANTIPSEVYIGLM